MSFGGQSNKGDLFKNNWDDVQLYQADDRDVVWKELVAFLTFLHSLRHSFYEKVVHIHADNDAYKHVLSNMRAKLGRPDDKVSSMRNVESACNMK